MHTVVTAVPEQHAAEIFELGDRVVSEGGNLVSFLAHESFPSKVYVHLFLRFDALHFDGGVLFVRSGLEEIVELMANGFDGQLGLMVALAIESGCLDEALRI